MPNSKNDRTLPEVFKELQEIRKAQVRSYNTTKLNKKNIFKGAINIMATKRINVASIIVLIFMIITVSTGYIFANNIEEEKVEIKKCKNICYLLENHYLCTYENRHYYRIARNVRGLCQRIDTGTSPEKGLGRDTSAQSARLFY